MKTMILRTALVSAAALTIGGPAMADHSWSTYHWQKGSGELTVPIGDNVDIKWDSYLRVAVGGTSVGDWNDSDKIESPLVPGATDPRRCKAAANRIEVCSAKYGRTGWLGIAGISISGGHITSGYTKLNDTYFDTAQYNKPSWRRMVTCQEIGHDYGLGHVNENFDDPNTGSCMDYSSDPGRNDGAGTNEYVNQHDYDQLRSIYNHAELAATDFGQREVGKAAPSGEALGLEGGNSPADWGRAIRFDKQGRPFLFEKQENGRKIITHVFWAMGEGPRSGGQHHDDGRDDGHTH